MLHFFYNDISHPQGYAPSFPEFVIPSLSQEYIQAVPQGTLFFLFFYNDIPPPPLAEGNASSLPELYISYLPQGYIPSLQQSYTPSLLNRQFMLFHNDDLSTKISSTRVYTITFPRVYPCSIPDESLSLPFLRVYF